MPVRIVSGRSGLSGGVRPSDKRRAGWGGTWPQDRSVHATRPQRMQARLDHSPQGLPVRLRRLRRPWHTAGRRPRRPGTEARRGPAGAAHRRLRHIRAHRRRQRTAQWLTVPWPTVCVDDGDMDNDAPRLGAAATGPAPAPAGTSPAPDQFAAPWGARGYLTPLDGPVHWIEFGPGGLAAPGGPGVPPLVFVH